MTPIEKALVVNCKCADKLPTQHNFCALCGFCGNEYTKREHGFYHGLWYRKTRGVVKSLAFHSHLSAHPE